MAIEHGTAVTKRQAFYHWNIIKEEWDNRFKEDPTYKEKGVWDSFYKVQLTREQLLDFIKFIKAEGMVKAGEPHNYKVEKLTTMRYERVLQSPSKRKNYEVVLHIEKYEKNDYYTVGLAYKGIYPKSSYRTYKTLKHHAYMFMW